MRAVPAIAVILAPTTAHAADGSGGGFSFAAGFLQMAASLAIVLGVIYLAHYLVKRVLGGGLGSGRAPRYIRVVESRFLAPKKSLMLVEVGGEYLLLGTTGEGISLIKQVEMLEEIEVVEDLAGRQGAGKASFTDLLAAAAETVGKKFTMPVPARKGMVSHQ